MTKPFYKLVPLALITAVGCFFLLSGTSSAATINVSTNDTATSTNDADCTLREAIENINTQTNTNTDCAAGDGNNDTIIIPTGTVTLSANLPQITKSISIEGQGMGASVVDGDEGAYAGFQFYGTGAENFSISKLKVSEMNGQGILAANVFFNASEVEVYGGADKPGSTTDMTGGIGFGNTLGMNLIVEMTDIYVHDLQTSSGALNAILISGTTTDNGLTNASLTNVTVSNIHSTSADIINAIAFSMFDGVEQTINASIKNVTVSNIENSSTAYGIVAVGASGAGNSNATLNVTNATINHIRGAPSPYGAAAGIAAGGISLSPSFSTTVNINMQNVVVSDVLAVNTGQVNCGTLDLTSGFGGTGTPSLSLVSGGGNLSDDNSCSTYFTQPTDQNNVAALAASLLPLADNGGYVPTMALKEGSPAIDSGITVSGLTTDARLALRPQGSAYDSGAYESPYTKPAAPVATLVNSGESIVVGLVVSSVVLTTLYMTTKRKQLSY